MSSIAVHPSTFEGIKRLAKSLKREQQIPHNKALDAAAVRAGYANFRHAQDRLPLLTTPKRKLSGAGHPLWITAYWRDKEGRAGRETLQVEARQAWGSLLRPKDLRASRGLARFRADAADHLESREDLADQTAARRAVCEAARTLQFMEASGLRPLTAYVSRLAHLGRSMPQRDHPSYWVHPDTQGLFAIDEPYSDPQEILPSRRGWASQNGAAIAATTWNGMYFPEHASLYLTSHDGREVELHDIVERLNAEPPPVSAEAWTGDSASYVPLFISPERASSGRAKRGRLTPKHVGMVRRKAVVYSSALAGGCWRPDAKMPIPAHKEAGNHLKELLERGGLRSHAHYRIEHVRAELEEWVQREHRREELSDREFSRLYYNEPTPSQRSPEAMIARVEDLLREHYPDCVPRRDLLRCLRAARRDLGR